MADQDTPKVKDYLTTREVADICCVNRATVVRWIQNKDLYAGCTLGGRYRICPKDLLSLSNEKGIFLSPEKCTQYNINTHVVESGTQIRQKNIKKSKAKILVIDDDESFRNLLTEFLTIRGYAVITADNGYSGLDYILKDYTINLVILDLLMPGISGVETMEQIKNLRKDLPIIITTGFLDYHFPDGISSLSDKADIVLEKPFDLKELYESCNSLLNHKG